MKVWPRSATWNRSHVPEPPPTVHNRLCPGTREKLDSRDHTAHMFTDSQTLVSAVSSTPLSVSGGASAKVRPDDNGGGPTDSTATVYFGFQVRPSGKIECVTRVRTGAEGGQDKECKWQVSSIQRSHEQNYGAQCCTICVSLPICSPERRPISSHHVATTNSLPTQSSPIQVIPRHCPLNSHHYRPGTSQLGTTPPQSRAADRVPHLTKHPRNQHPQPQRPSPSSLHNSGPF